MFADDDNTDGRSTFETLLLIQKTGGRVRPVRSDEGVHFVSGMVQLLGATVVDLINLKWLRPDGPRDYRVSKGCYEPLPAPFVPHTPILARYVPRSAVITPYSQCLACGAVEGTYGLHEVAICRACNSPTCVASAPDGGICPVCSLGILPYRTANPVTCDCEGCMDPAAAWLLGRARCLFHFNRCRPRYLAKIILNRHKTWRLCESVCEPE